MSIPLEPTQPVTGVSSPAPAPIIPRPYKPRAMPPWRMWAILRAVTQLRKDVTPDVLAQWIVPKGFPGAGIFHGRTNVAKSVTYRATYVPGGFNIERDKWRKARNALLGHADFGDVNDNPA